MISFAAVILILSSVLLFRKNSRVDELIVIYCLSLLNYISENTIEPSTIYILLCFSIGFVLILQKIEGRRNR